MKETLREKIEDLKYQIKKIDGHTWGYNIGNRIYGLLGLTLCAIGTHGASGTPAESLLPAITIPLAIEMIGDIATGKHHFISYRLFRVHPKYELEKLLKQSQSNNPTK